MKHPSPSTRRLAVSLAVDRGWHLFPVDHPSLPRCRGIGKRHDPDTCRKRGKHPTVSFATWATADPELLVTPRYFGGREPRNIGIACGPSGVAVLDEDQAAELERFQRDTGIEVPATFTVSTRDGRRHLYYFQRDDVEPLGNSEGALRGYAVDVRGVGGFVVGPGSTHETGAIYAIVDNVDPVVLPRDLYDAIAKRPASTEGADGKPEAKWWADGPIPAGAKGGHHKALVAASGWCRRMGLSRDLAVPTIRDVFHRFTDHTAEPYTWDEALEVLDDVYDRYPAGYRFDELGPRLVGMPDEFSDTSDTPPGALSETRQAADQHKHATSDTSDTSDTLLTGLRTGAWLDVQDFPPLRYHLPGIIPEGSTLLVGPPKIGKSWFVLALGLATASGSCVFGMVLKQRPVLYLALEDSDRRMQWRCRMLLGHDVAIPPTFEYMTRVEPGTVLATVAEWLAPHADAEPLVILDTLGKVMPPAQMGESSYQRDYRVAGALKRLVDAVPGGALIVNHHDRKAGADDFVERVSGTHGLAGAADTIVVLVRPRHGDSGRLHVTGRDVAEGEYAVNFDGEQGVWSLDGADLAEAAKKAREAEVKGALDEQSTRLLMFVEQRQGDVKASDAVEAELFEDTDTAGKYLRRLADSGRIVKTSRGVFTRLPQQAALSDVSEVSETQQTRRSEPRAVSDTEHEGVSEVSESEPAA